MQRNFTGRAAELAQVDVLLNNKEGAVFAVVGTAGMGKTTLLTQIAEIYQQKPQAFIDMNDLPPLTTAVEFLKHFATCAKGLKHTQQALAKLDETYKSNADLIAPYKDVLQQTVEMGIAEHQEDSGVTDGEMSKLTAITQTVLQLGGVLSKRRLEKEKQALGEPELYSLEAIKKDCGKQPLIFIDTYERLQAAQELSQQKIVARFAKLDERLARVEQSLSLQDWLERFLAFCQSQGALVLVAGRNVGHWQLQAQGLERFEDEDILQLVVLSAYPMLQGLLDEGEQQQQLLALLKRLSFGGVPLWLQLALNFVSLELQGGREFAALVASENLEDLFAAPLYSHELDSANVDNASCKLALFKRVMQHNLELANEAWKMALPRRLDKAVLAILFADKADLMQDAFVNAGLLPSVRWLDDTVVRLHEEIRDLLLAYAKHKECLETDETKALHQQLADLFTQRYQSQQQLTPLLEQIYHQSVIEKNNSSKYLNQPELLKKIAFKLHRKKQYREFTQVFLELIDIQPDNEKMLLLGAALTQQERWKEASDIYQQCVINSEAEFAWQGLGLAYWKQRKLNEAIKIYLQQLNVNPKHEQARSALGIAYFKQGQLEKAQQAYAHVLEINPDKISALSNDAELALIQQDSSRCRQRIQQALALVDNKTCEYAILPFLAWLAEPESSYQPVLNAIQTLDPSVKITWDFSDTEPAITRLNTPQQTIARQFIGYFQGKNELPPAP